MINALTKNMNVNLLNNPDCLFTHFICHVCLLNGSIYSDFYLNRSAVIPFFVSCLVEHQYHPGHSHIKRTLNRMKWKKNYACDEQQSVEQHVVPSSTSSQKTFKSKTKLIFRDGHRHIALLTNCFSYSLRSM